RVLGQHDSEAAVGGIPHRHLHTAAGHHAGHDQLADAEVAQQVLDVGPIEYAAAGLGEHDLVGERSHFVQDFGLLRARREVDAQPLVLQAPVAAIAGQRGDAGVDDLYASRPASRLQARDVGHDQLFETPAVVVRRGGVATVPARLDG